MKHICGECGQDLGSNLACGTCRDFGELQRDELMDTNNNADKLQKGGY